MVETLVSVLKKAGVSFAMIGSEESDSGALARYMGEEGLFAELVESLMGQFDEKGIRKVICVSPHDYDAFLSYYEQNGAIQFTHYSEVLLELIENKKIEPVDKLNKRVTYHDPCYLGRKHDIYDAPRGVLKSIPGLELVEMERNQELAYCCGGGGTGLWCELPRIQMNRTRVDQAKEKNAEYIAVTCPVCLQMLDDGVKSKNYDIVVKDIVQILDEAI
jgi:Fe-S oxidoreductase